MHVVVTVHGIRTFGQWQDRLERLVRASSPETAFFHYRYGYFSILAFLFPAFRWIETRRFRKSLLQLVGRYRDAEISIVGHSFGTHLIGWGLYGIPRLLRPNIRSVILAGSVLKTSFPWGDLQKDDCLQQVVNDCGIQDKILLLSQLFVLLTGMAGRLGFRGFSSDRFQNRYFVGGHSHYFLRDGVPDDEFMTRYWAPVLATSAPVEPHDAREVKGPLQGIVLTLLQVSDPLKLLVYAGLPVLAFKMFWLDPLREKDDQFNLVSATSLASGSLAVEAAAARIARVMSIREGPDSPHYRQILTYLLQRLSSLTAMRSALPTLSVREWRGKNYLFLGTGQQVIPGNGLAAYGITTDSKQIVLIDDDKTLYLIDANGTLIMKTVLGVPPGNATSAGASRSDTPDQHPTPVDYAILQRDATRFMVIGWISDGAAKGHYIFYPLDAARHAVDAIELPPYMGGYLRKDCSAVADQIFLDPSGQVVRRDYGVAAGEELREIGGKSSEYKKLLVTAPLQLRGDRQSAWSVSKLQVVDESEWAQMPWTVPERLVPTQCDSTFKMISPGNSNPEDRHLAFPHRIAEPDLWIKSAPVAVPAAAIGSSSASPEPTQIMRQAAYGPLRDAQNRSGVVAVDAYVAKLKLKPGGDRKLEDSIEEWNDIAEVCSEFCRTVPVGDSFVAVGASSGSGGVFWRICKADDLSRPPCLHYSNPEQSEEGLLLSPDRSHLVIFGRPNYSVAGIGIVELATLRDVSPTEFKEQAAAAAFSPDSATVAVVTYSNALWIIRTRDGTEMRVPLQGSASTALLQDDVPPSQAVKIVGDIVICRYGPTSLAAFKLSDGQLLWVTSIAALVGQGLQISVNADGSIIAVNDDAVIQLFSTFNGMPLDEPVRLSDLVSETIEHVDEEIVTFNKDNELDVLLTYLGAAKPQTGPVSQHLRRPAPRFSMTAKEDLAHVSDWTGISDADGAVLLQTLPARHR